MGLVATRFFGATVAAATSATRRWRASSRLRSWVRKRCALSTSTPSAVMRRSRRASSRAFTSAGSEGELAMSKRSSTAVETLFTFCPPGSPSGMDRVGVISSMAAFYPRTPPCRSAFRRESFELAFGKAGIRA